MTSFVIKISFSRFGVDLISLAVFNSNVCL